MSAKAKQVEGFTIAGADKHFLPASAELYSDGKAVTVWNDTITKPMSVRYAWADNPVFSIFDEKKRFPLAPFRTDHWHLSPNNSNLEKYIGSQMTHRAMQLK
jgi:sialate O-acetylesterase